MHSGNETKRILFLIMIGFILSTSLFVLFDSVYAQTLHDRILDEIVKQTSGFDDISSISMRESPSYMGIDATDNKIYVANSDSDSVSVIDGYVNKVVTGVKFNVNTFDSGYIKCSNLTTPSPTGQYFYVYSSTTCTAKPNDGFEFLSWEENLNGNSTQIINFKNCISFGPFP